MTYSEVINGTEATQVVGLGKAQIFLWKLTS